MTNLIECLFYNEWGVWFVFASQEGQTAQDYHKKYMRAYIIRSPSDLALVWNQNKLNNLDNFLVTSNNKQVGYYVNDQLKKINSIQYFKKDIEPKWEDPKNAQGGRFVFTVNKNQQNKDQIYTNLVLFLMGQDFNYSDKINGFRFISPKSSQTFYRVQIWVNFNDSETQVLKHYQNILTNLFKQLNYDSKQVKFLNNTTEKNPKDSKQTNK